MGWNLLPSSFRQGHTASPNMTLGLAIDPPSVTFIFDPCITNVATTKIQRQATRIPLHVCEFQAFGYVTRWHLVDIVD